MVVPVRKGRDGDEAYRSWCRPQAKSLVSPGIAFRAGQGSYTKQKDVTYGYRPKPHPALEARPRFEWLVRWGGGAGPRHFAAAGSCAGASKRGELHYSISRTGQKQVFFQGLLALLPLWWVCEVRIWGISGGRLNSVCRLAKYNRGPLLLHRGNMRART